MTDLHTSCTEIFEPVQTRRGPIYPDLSQHNFSVGEKRGFLHLLGTEEVNGQATTRSELCVRFKIPRTTTAGWSTKSAVGERIYQSKGRPPRMDAEGKRNTVAKLNALCDAMETPDRIVTTAIIESEIKASDDSKNQSNVPATKPTILAIEKRLDIRDVTCDVISHARFQACNDPRMSYTQAILTKVGTEGLDPHNIWNWDATQFTVGFNKTGRRVCVVHELNTQKTPKVIEKSTLNLAIKWMHLGSAAGEAAPLLLLISIPEMNATDFYTYEVPGLSHLPVSGMCGKVAFCQSRAGNDKFFDDYIKNQVVPALDNSRKFHSCPVSGQ